MKRPYRLDVICRNGGLLVFVKKDIPSKYLRNFLLPSGIQAIPTNVNLKQRKPLIVSIYRPPHQKLDYFLASLIDLRDHYFNYLSANPTKWSNTLKQFVSSCRNNKTVKTSKIKHVIS